MIPRQIGSQVMTRCLILATVCLCLAGCLTAERQNSNWGLHGTALADAGPDDASSSTAPDRTARLDSQDKAFDDHLAEATEKHGRFNVIELRVTDPPRGSGVQALFDEVQRLRQSVGVPDGHGEVEKGGGRFVIAPLADMHYFAARIEFGTIIKIDQQQRVVIVQWQHD